MRKLKLTKASIIGICTVFIISIGVAGALNGWFGGGGKIPEDTFTRGLVGYWSFDEGTGNTAYDISGNGNNGTLTNGPQWTRGKIGGALEFDRTDDYVEITKTSSLENALTSDGTIELWIHPNSDWNDRKDHGIFLPGTNYQNWSIYKDWNQDYLTAFIGGLKIYGTLTWEQKWIHILYTWTGIGTSNSQIELYIDGSFAGRVTGTSSVPLLNDTFKLGSALGRLNGIIDEVRIYNRALSAEEIRYHYNRGGPVAYWKFDEGEGKVAFDSTDNNNSGHLHGPALSFDGADDYVEVPDNDNLDLNNEITIMVWIKPETYSDTYATILQKGNDGSENYEIVYYSGNFHLGWVFSSGRVAWNTNVEWNLNNWQFIVVTYKPNDWRFYKNGELVAERTDISGTLVTNSISLWIGNEEPTRNEHFSGIIDEVRIYNRALSATEVLEHYRGIYKDNTGLVGYWAFDENSGQTAYDSSGNGNNGSLGSTTGADTNDPTWVNYAPSWTKGVYGSALSFDGVDDYMEASPMLARTISVWIKTTSLGGVGPPPDGMTIVDTRSIQVWLVNGHLYAWGNFNNTWTGFEGTIAVNDGKWHHVAHVAISQNGNTLSQLWVDGRLDREELITGEVTLATSGDNVLRIGVDGYTLRSFFSGTIDEVRIYNYARTPDEIRLDYQAGLATHLGPKGKSCSEDPASCMDYGLVGYWSFDEGTGQTAYDSSGSGNNGTLGASSATGSDDPKWTRGKIGGALSFDGVDDYVNVSYDSSLDVDEITISAWIKTSVGGSPHNPILAKLQSYNVGGGYYLRLRYGQVALMLSNGTNYGDKWGGPEVNDGEWHYIVATYDGSYIRVYVDGIDVGSPTSWTGGIANPSVQLRIGRGGTVYDNTSYFKGTIDEVRIYNRALSEEEIRYHYNRGTPVLHLKFDEGSGTTIYDSTENNNDGTLNLGTGGNTTVANAWVQGKYGTALSFDGVDDYVEVPDSSSLDITGAITIEAWVKPNDLTDIGVIVSKGDQYTSADDHYIFGLGSDEAPYIYFGNPTDSAVNSETPISIGRWSHLAVTRDSSGNIKFYINGDIVKTGTLGQGTPNSYPLVIGRQSSGFRYFSGLIDDVRIYNYARTPEQIRTDYNAGLATHFGPSDQGCSRDPASCMTKGLVGYWSFDEGAGSTAHDSSDYSNNGSLGGGTTSKMPKWKRGKHGAALQFDGVDDYVEVPDSSSLDITDAITIEVWVKATEQGGKAILAKGVYPGTVQFNLNIYQDTDKGHINYILRINDTVVSKDSSVNQIPFNEWFHFVVTYDGTQIRNYFNGELDKSYNQTGSLTPTATDLWIGDRENGNIPFSGLIDEVRIYNRALSAEEIRYHYNRGAPIAYWKFNEGEGSVAYDSTENDNDGTIYGATWTEGKFGSALSFDGIDDYVDAGNVYNGVKTVSFWMKPDTLTTSVLDLNGTQTITISNGTIQANNFSSPTIYVDGKVSSVIPDTGWHHISITTSSDINASGVLLGKVGTSYFSGILDDVKLYSYVRSAEQIKMDYLGRAVRFK